jgi:Mor family transcriptional regulator
MANRPKLERNEKIWEYWQRGYRQVAIARMYKMTEKAVNAVIRRERIRRGGDGDSRLNSIVD